MDVRNLTELMTRSDDHGSPRTIARMDDEVELVRIRGGVVSTGIAGEARTAVRETSE